jgi:putative salt-induced outer membrane protein YdiY
MREHRGILRLRSGAPAWRLWMVVLAGLGWSSLCRAGSDTLMTANGDRLVGTVKKLERAVLQFDTDYADQEFSVEWKQVRMLTSKALFDLETADGQRYIGPLHADPEQPGEVVVGTVTGPRRVKLMEIVRLEPVEKSFWERLDASVDLGYTLTKANDSRQSTARGALGYRSEDWRVGAQFSSVQNRTSDGPKTRKADALADYQHRAVKRWFAFVKGTFAMSDEQRLDARYTANGGIGNYVVATPELDLLVSGGLTVMAEDFQDPGVPNEKNVEGLLSAEFHAFDIGDLNVFSTVSAFQNLRDAERTRGNFTLDLKWDLPLDFTFKVALTLDYDSKPPNGASKSDYVLSTTFGWEL